MSENLPKNFAEQFQESKEFLLGTLSELRATGNLYREILIRDEYEKLHNNSLLIEAKISWDTVEHFITESAKMIYAKGMSPEIDLLESLVDSELKSVKLLWNEIKEKYPPIEVKYVNPQPPDDLSRN